MLVQQVQVEHLAATYRGNVLNMNLVNHHDNEAPTDPASYPKVLILR